MQLNTFRLPGTALVQNWICLPNTYWVFFDVAETSHPEGTLASSGQVTMFTVYNDIKSCRAPAFPLPPKAYEWNPTRLGEFPWFSVYCLFQVRNVPFFWCWRFSNISNPWTTKEIAVQERGEVINSMPPTHSVKEPKGDQKEANVLYMFKMFQDYRGKKCQVLSADSFGTTNNLEFVLLRCFCIFLNYVWTLRETLKMSRVMMLPTSLNHRCKEIKCLSKIEAWRFRRNLQGHQERLLTCVAWCLIDKASHFMLELPMSCVELFWTTSRLDMHSPHHRKRHIMGRIVCTNKYWSMLLHIAPMAPTIVLTSCFQKLEQIWTK